MDNEYQNPIASRDPIKRCAKCRKFKQKSEFTKDKKSKDGLYNWCKACLNLHRRERTRKIREAWGTREPSRKGFKSCPSCDETKPKTEFYLNRMRKDGLSSYCKGCAIKRAKPYYSGKRRLRILFGVIKRRAQKTKIPFHITFEDFFAWDKKHGPIENRKCPSCGCTIAESKTFQKKRGKKRLCGFTVDRIDSNKGYALENLQLLCFICNMVKGKCFNMDEIKKIGRVIGSLQREAIS